jgi:hypothetical protein
MGEAAEDLRDEREERGASRDAYYREEAQDRRLDRGIRGDRYSKFEREELIDERYDRRQEREIDDHVRLQRSAFLGGVFASEEDRAFRRIVQRESREEKLDQYRELIQQCEDRIREYHTMEDWLDEIKRSGFEADTIEQVRAEARERRLSFITQQSQVGLLTERTNWTEEERKVLNDLAYVREEESVYDDILRACDTADPDKLESALANLKACVADVGDVLRRIPRLAAGQQRKYNNSDSLGQVLQGGLTGGKYGVFATPVTFIGGCVAGLAGGGFLAGLSTGFTIAILTVPIGFAVGGAIGFFKWKAENRDHFHSSL